MVNLADTDPFDFTVISDLVARFVVRHEQSDLSLRRDPAHLYSRLPQEGHAFGLRNAPLFRIWQPWSPDDTWKIEPLSTGATINADNLPDLVLSDPYFNWISDKITGGAEIPYLLPSGEYLLVCTKRKLMRPRQIQLGNGLVERPHNALVLCEEDPFTACIFGPDLNTEPLTSLPLVGVPILNYNGHTSMPGILFFAMSHTSQIASTTLSTVGYRVLIVPLRSELILDVLALFQSSEPAEKMWKKQQAAEFVSWCTTHDL